jgi:hypothetical protein
MLHLLVLVAICKSRRSDGSLDVTAALSFPSGSRGGLMSPLGQHPPVSSPGGHLGSGSSGTGGTFSRGNGYGGIATTAKNILSRWVGVCGGVCGDTCVLEGKEAGMQACLSN